MLFNPRYGRLAWLAFPYFFFLEMFGPVIEFLGYGAFAYSLAMGWASAVYASAFICVAFFLGVALSVAAVGLEELTFRRYPGFGSLLRLFYLAVLENFGYRQLCTYWRFRGILAKLFRVKGWGRMERKGFKLAGGP
jgi:hypothetical protein